MATNLPPDWFKYYNDYMNAKTKEEKIRTLEIVISHTPKHKASEKLLAQLKSKLSKLKEQKEARKGFKKTTIPKEGDAQVCIIGLTQSGKSSLLSKLTNAKPQISDRPYTTTKPEIGMMEYQGVKIQLVEIPSTFKSNYLNIAQNSDGLIIVLDPNKDLMDQKIEIRKVMERIDKPAIEVLGKRIFDEDHLKKRIWNMIGMIRVYTKEPGKNPEKKALVLKTGSTVKDAARNVHKDFIKYFKFARVWGKSINIQGSAVGLDHILEDGDILEIHIS